MAFVFIAQVAGVRVVRSVTNRGRFTASVFTF